MCVIQIDFCSEVQYPSHTWNALHSSVLVVWIEIVSRSIAAVHKSRLIASASDLIHVHETSSSTIECIIFSIGNWKKQQERWTPKPDKFWWLKIWQLRLKFNLTSLILAVNFLHGYIYGKCYFFNDLCLFEQITKILIFGLHHIPYNR